MVIYFKKLFRILFKYFHIHLENSMCGKLQRVILKCKKDNSRRDQLRVPTYNTGDKTESVFKL
jgi:hypothetical protein